MHFAEHGIPHPRGEIRPAPIPPDGAANTRTCNYEHSLVSSKSVHVGIQKAICVLSKQGTSPQGKPKEFTTRYRQSICIIGRICRVGGVDWNGSNRHLFGLSNPLCLVSPPPLFGLCTVSQSTPCKKGGVIFSFSTSANWIPRNINNLCKPLPLSHVHNVVTCNNSRHFKEGASHPYSWYRSSQWDHIDCKDSSACAGQHRTEESFLCWRETLRLLDVSRSFHK